MQPADEHAGGGHGLRSRVGLSLIVLLLSASALEAGENLLRLSGISESFAVIREQRLVDGKVPHAESPIDDFVATLFLGADAYVVFDLGLPTRVAAVQLVAADDAVSVELSADGSDYAPVRLAPEGRSGPMEVLVGRDPVDGVRFVRLALEAGLGRGAVGEALVWRDPPPVLPQTLEAQQPPTFSETAARVVARERWVSRALFLVAAGAIPVLLIAARAGRRRRALLCAVLVAIGFLGWIRLGTFLGGGRILHSWDQTHYYLGAKYFREMRYRELYRCLAAWERQRGRGLLVDGVRVRNLDTNRTEPGSWTSTPAGRCRSEFTAERWRQFGADADGLRRTFTLRRLHDILKDHGYNATPVLSAVLEPLVLLAPPRPGPLLFLAALDLAALGGAIWALWRGFGPVAAAGGALVIGLADPWAYTWTGGSLGRQFWLLALCVGLMLLRRRRWLSGSALLGAAALLRLFPAALLAGPAIRVVDDFLTRRNVQRAWRVTFALGATLLVGVALPAMLYGSDVWVSFFDDILGHGRAPSTNYMGLGAIVSAGLTDSVLAASPDGSYLWRRLAWLATALLAAGWLVWMARRRGEVWKSIPLAAPLLFCSIPMSSYDFIWLVVLVPLLVEMRLGLVTLLGFVALSNLVQEVVPEGRTTYLLFSVGILAVLAVFVWQASRMVDRPGVGHRLESGPYS